MPDTLSAAEAVKRERIARHASGDHDWQPGPLVPSQGNRFTMALVCACGVVRRAVIPREVEAVHWDGTPATWQNDALPEEPHDA